MHPISLGAQAEAHGAQLSGLDQADNGGLADAQMLRSFG